MQDVHVGLHPGLT